MTIDRFVPLPIASNLFNIFSPHTTVTANQAFQTIADVDIKLCSAGICTPNIVEEELNVCRQLDLLDEDGYEMCNQPGNYTLEASFTLPSHTWWADLAFEGFSFNMFVTLDNDLECHAEFVTHVYYGTEAWMTLAVGSLVVVMGFSWWARKKCKVCCEGDPDTLKEILDDDQNTTQAKFHDDGIVILSSPSEVSQQMNATDVHGERAVKRVENMNNDDDSVTTHAYQQMLDFSPQGLSHVDQMEQVRQAHFERLRRTRNSRRVTKLLSQEGLV